MDDFKNMAAVRVTLEISDGVYVSKNMPIAACFRTAHPLPRQTDMYPAVGDVIELGWDYERFEGLIYKLAPNRQPIEDIPVEGSKAFDLRDIIDSLSPSAQEASDGD